MVMVLFINQLIFPALEAVYHHVWALCADLQQQLSCGCSPENELSDVSLSSQALYLPMTIKLQPVEILK